MKTVNINKACIHHLLIKKRKHIRATLRKKKKLYIEELETSQQTNIYQTHIEHIKTFIFVFRSKTFMQRSIRSAL